MATLFYDLAITGVGWGGGSKKQKCTVWPGLLEVLNRCIKHVPSLFPVDARWAKPWRLERWVTGYASPGEKAMGLDQDKRGGTVNKRTTKHNGLTWDRPNFAVLVHSLLVAPAKIGPDPKSHKLVLTAARFWPQRWLAVRTIPQDLIGCWNQRKLKALIPNLRERSAVSGEKELYHLYWNFGEKFPSNATGIFFGTENRNGIELYHWQNTGKFFASSRHEAWHW